MLCQALVVASDKQEQTRYQLLSLVDPVLHHPLHSQAEVHHVICMQLMHIPAAD
jgi:hypothetical protein